MQTNTALILAAGLGTRMRSSLAKVLHPLSGRVVVGWVVQAAREAGLKPLLVVHHQEDAVRSALPGCAFVRQETPRGTGDAVSSALGALPEHGVVVVMAGDAPLIRASTIRSILDAHGGNLATALTARVPEPGAYGRLLRDELGRPARIVEAAECTAEQLLVDEINVGLYAFDAAWLHRVVPGLQPHPPKGEIYLTDLVELAAAEGRCGAVVHGDPDEVTGVNDRWMLATAEAELQQRIKRSHAEAGVTFQDVASVRVEAEVRLAVDVTLGPGVVLSGATVVGEGASIGAHCVVVDSVIEAGAAVHPLSVLEGAVVRGGASVGPMARLRPGADVGPGARVGNFVEVKKSRLLAGAKVNHLSYIGDATVGEGANIGAGTITANYDGFKKHHTEIGAGAYTGSNTVLVAPVRLGARAMTGACAAVRKDVPDDAIAVSEGRQVNRPGAAARYRRDKGGQ